MVPDNEVQERLDVRSMRVGAPGQGVEHSSAPATSKEPRFVRPSARRSDEVRARRHRERAIAAWLRDLAR